MWRAHNQIIVDSAPTPLFWAVGLSDPEHLGAYASIGFNTIEIVIGAPTAQTWEAAGALAEAAAGRGLYVLLTLVPPESALGAPARFRASPLDPAYRAAVAAYLRPIVAHGAELPGMIGWVLEGADNDSLRYDAGDFMHYLLGWHGSAAAIRQAWRFPVGDLGAITEGVVAGLDSSKPLSLGRASVDLARYRAEVYGDLLDLWAGEIRGLDRRHVVLAGRQHSYRSAISVPSSCDGMLLGLYPGVAEDDLETHNIQGVDIARRANQFAALPVLKVSAALSGARLAEWVAQAVLHGAAGVGFADWSDIRPRDDLRGDLRRALLAIREGKLCPRVVAAAAAVLYEPFAAGGFANGRPLYGWLTGASASEPGRLFRALAQGTVFGQIDYLSESSIESVDLSRYGVIIAPLALSLTPSEQAALIRYVSGGGTFLADLGAGFVQSGSLALPPPALAELFGVGPVPETQQGTANFVAMTPQARFPSLRPQMGTYSGDHPATFDPPIHLVLLANGAAPVLSQLDSAPAFAGVMARPHGKGWALYGTTRLWQNWQPGNPAFDAFHRDLFGFSSPAALDQPAGVVPGDEFGMFEDGSVMLIKRRGGRAEVLLRNPDCRVYQIRGGMQEIRAASESANSRLTFGLGGVQVAEPLPIQVATDAGRVFAQVVAYSEEGISFCLYGPGTQAVVNQSAGVAARPSGEAVAHVRISRGTYLLPRRSRHEVRIRPLGSQKGTVSEVAVGEEGVLVFDAPANAVITITPVGRVARPEA